MIKKRVCSVFFLIGILFIMTSVVSAENSIQGYIENLDSTDPELRKGAVIQLGEVGAELEDQVIASMVKLLADNDSDVTWNTSRALENIGVRVIPYLEKFLEKEESNWARQRAVRLMGNIGSSKSTETLLQATKDSDHNVRRAAVSALAKVRTSEYEEDIINNLSKVVQNDRNTDIKAEAIALLGEIDIEHPLTVLALAHALEDVQQVTWPASRILTSNTENMLAVLIDLLESEDENVRRASSLVIRHLRINADQSLVNLIGVFEDVKGNNRETRKDVLKTIAQINNLSIDDLRGNQKNVDKLLGQIVSKSDIEKDQLKTFEKNVGEILMRDFDYTGEIPENWKYDYPPVPGEWDLVFWDDFSGDSLDLTKWRPQYPWGAGYVHNHRAYMLTENVIVEDGMLRLRAEDERHPDAPRNHSHDSFGDLSVDYTSGIITTHDTFRYNYGYIEASMRVPDSRGFWPAFWLLGDGWPPEVDIMEVLTHEPSHVHMVYHYGENWENTGSHYRKLGPGDGVPDLSDGFHVYGFEWSPNHMAWYLNGREMTRYTNRQRISESYDMYILINLAVGGWAADPDHTTNWPAYFDTEWVRVWQKRGAPGDFSWNRMTLDGNLTYSIQDDRLLGRASIRNSIDLTKKVDLEIVTRFNKLGQGWEEFLSLEKSIENILISNNNKTIEFEYKDLEDISGAVRINTEIKALKDGEVLGSESFDSILSF
ncbi:HEAT repeat domain-containing protein [Natronospora cellulosivora (SeqCode)]